MRANVSEKWIAVGRLAGSRTLLAALDAKVSRLLYFQAMSLKPILIRSTRVERTGTCSDTSFLA